MINLSDWIQHKKNQQAYTEWLKSPVTQAMFAGLRGNIHVTMHGVVTGDDALKAIGFHSGKDATISIMENLLDLVNAASKPSLTSSTSLAYLVNFEGYSEQEAKEILKKNGAGV